jgi:glycosyltransferase involved in cell wall biosynthesis
MSDILFISAHLPVEMSRQAGHKTAWRNLQWFAQRHQVHLLAFRSEGDCGESLDALRSVCAKVHVIELTFGSRLNGILWNPTLPLCVAARSSNKARQVIQTWSSETEFDRVHAEWSQLGQYFQILPRIPERSIYVHDVLSQWAERKASGRLGWFWKWESRRTRRWETRIYEQCSRLYVPSPKDGELIYDYSPSLRHRISVLPLHFDLYRSALPRSYEGTLRILFWGALGRRENADAARWLCRLIVPRLRQQGRRFELVLAGSNPPADLVSLQSSDVKVTGFIQDPTFEFSRAHLALAPLFEGAGVKVKVLECLSAGLPVLTTEIGAEGIDATLSDGLIVLQPDPEIFLRMICSLDRDRSWLAELGAAASRWGDCVNKNQSSVLLG